jgi:hypothetical protein
MQIRQGPGRPRKYGRPSRAVTLTLPQDVLDRLGAVHADVGQAIVDIVENRPAPRRRERRSAELASYGNHAVIVVTPIKALKRLPGVQLIPIGDGRALISLESPHSIPHLELALRDAMDRGAAGEPERKALNALAEILRDARLSRGVTLEERTIIVLESKRLRSAAAGNGKAIGRRPRKQGTTA